MLLGKGVQMIESLTSLSGCNSTQQDNTGNEKLHISICNSCVEITCWGKIVYRSFMQPAKHKVILTVAPD